VRVADVMTRVRIGERAEAPLRAAAARMWREQTGSLVVLDGDRLLGIITERDILRAAAEGVDLAATPVSAVMTADVLTVDRDESLSDAARMMAHRWVRHLPVTHDGAVVGVLSQRDVVGVFAALWRDDSAPGASIEADQLVSARRLARIEHGDLD
jgi:CBS domain-containing protein